MSAFAIALGERSAAVAKPLEGCWWEMPAEREAEICQKALELLSDLCSKGEVQDDNCLDFISYLRDLARPGYADTGQALQALSDFAWGRIYRRLLSSVCLKGFEGD